MSTHVYSIATDFTSLTADSPDLELLEQEIANSALGVLNFDYSLINGDVVNIVFVDTLSGGQVTTLGNIVAAHTGVNPLQFLDTKRVTFASRNPTVFDDGYAGFTTGSWWVNNITQSMFALLDDSDDAAIWSQVTNTSLDGYGSADAIEILQGDVINIYASLDGYALDSDLQVEVNRNDHQDTAIGDILGDLDGYIPTTSIGAPNGVAGLDVGGKIYVSQIPAVSLPEVFVVLDDTERLALTVQEGDEAIQTSDGYHYIYDGYIWYPRPGNDISAHVSDLDNPHQTGIDNLLPGTLAELNAIITDATLDDSGDPRPPTVHASTHISGGSDEIDGDQLDIDWNPSVYTPTTAPSEVTSIDHLTAHLAGIDDKLGNLEDDDDGLGDAVEQILVSLDGYALDSDLQVEVNRNDHQDTAIGDILDALDGYGTSNGIDVEDEGSSIGTFTTLNFTGAGVTAADAGGGTADITVTGGGGTGGKVLIPFGQFGVSGTTVLKSAGYVGIGHMVTSDYTLKKFSVVTSANNDKTYIVYKGVSAVASTTFSSEYEKLISGLNVSYSAGDRIWVLVTEASENINAPYTDDGYTIFLSHVDGSTEASRNIINSATNFTGLGGRCENGATLGVTGKFNKAANFDGSNDYIEILHQDEMDTANCTIELWFNADDTSGTQTLFSKDSSGYDTGGHQTYYISGNDLRIRSQNTGTSNDDTINVTVVPGTWHHLAVVLGTGGRKVFFDGGLVHTDGSWTDGMNGNREPIALGGSTAGSGNGLVTPLSDYFNGQICELRISNTRRYETGFTPQTSQFTSDANTIGLWHFDETSGDIISGVSGTVCNLMAQATTTSFPEIDNTIVKFGTNSVKMNNSQNDWLRQIHHTNYEQAQITVESWLYVYDNNGGVIFQKGDSCVEGALIVEFNNSNPHLEVTYYGATTSRTIITANNSFPKNTWHHFAITIDANDFTVFIDGAQAGTESLTSDYQNVWNNNDGDIYWGMKENNTNHMQAYYDELRISSTTRNYGGATVDVSVLIEMEE